MFSYICRRYYPLIFFASLIVTTPAGADIGLKHYEISLVCSKDKIQCEGVDLKYTYAERDKNIQSFPGQNTYKLNVVSSTGRTLKTLYFVVDKKFPSPIKKPVFGEEDEKVQPKQKSYSLQSGNIYKGDSLYRVKRKVKQDIEEQAIEDEKMKMLDKQLIILNIPWLKDALRMDIYNTMGQKIQTIRLDSMLR